MKFVIQGELCLHDVQTMAQVFFHRIGFEVVDNVPINGLCLSLQRKARPGSAVWARLYENGVVAEFFRARIVENDANGLSRATKLAIYSVLALYTGHRPPWGLLTGIRPAKVAAKLLNIGLSDNEVQQELRTYYLIERCRAELCTRIAHAQKDIADQGTNANTVSIYAAVPFCPSICHYCSFSSYPMDKYAKYQDSYVDALVKELAFIGQMCRDKYVENIYIGGGTPTALNDANFEKLLAAISDNFAVDKAKEYTVEAGRPDTITPAKLAAMGRRGVSRISINPQTLNDATLEKIGRRHTASQFLDAYKMAREAGFDNINIDLILGLPGETPDDVGRTLEGITALSPKSCTIHTLAVKRASRLNLDAAVSLYAADTSQMRTMLAIVTARMDALGLAPYYMYRQKNSPGNFENVGYATPGFACRYNIQMMEETQTILAAGAGAVTKLVDAAQSRINRVFNLRNPVEYSEKVDEMIGRKVNPGY